MNKIFSSALVSVFILTGCGGGGGGGGSSTPTTPTNPSPVINLSLSSSSITTGDSVTVTWSSTNSSSCSANGAWSGGKDTSGNESFVMTKSGTFNFGLSCSSSTSSSSKTVTLEVNAALNAYAYIDGPTTFSGFYIFKDKNSSARVKSIEVDMDINDKNSLFITEFRYSENRILGIFRDSNDNYDGQGVRLGESSNIDSETGEQITYYIPQISETFHSSNQIILNTNNSINPYTYPDQTSSLDDLEIFNADIILEFDPDFIWTYEGEDGINYPFTHDNIRMNVFAAPKGSEDSNDATFIGTYINNDSYAFLYLIDKREVDNYSNNLPTESDIFNKSLIMLDVYTSYQSQPNLELLTENGFRTKSDIAQINNISNGYARDTLNGSRLADAIDVTTNEVLGGGVNIYAIKYLQPDDSSNQRIFLKTSLKSDSFLTNDCLASPNPYRGCEAINWQLYFFLPNKETLVGLHLGGYFDEPHQTNARMLFDNE